MSDQIEDVVIVGAGAAGLMAAITCGRESLRVLLLDGREEIGAKILMSGGTRCNVTNFNVTEKDYQSETWRTIRNILRTFPSEQAVDFFKTLNVELILEEGGKYFPSTHSARTVLEALRREIQQCGAKLETPRKVTRVEFREGIFHILGNGFESLSRTVILCTGGLSYPSTGSDGAGYEIAKSLGHSLVPTAPALTPLLTEDGDWKKLTGVSLVCCLSLWVDGRKEMAYEDSFLFTHFGFSGPCALNISRFWVRGKEKGSRVELIANFLPKDNAEDFRERFIQSAKRNPKKTLKTFLSENLPEKFVSIFLKKISLEEAAVLNQVKQKDRELLIRSLFHFPLQVSGVMGYRKAEVTAGGVDLARVDSKTLESKIQPGLFFAGEILDVDGRIGGFNFQWAWSSAVAAGRGAAQRLRIENAIQP